MDTSETHVDSALARIVTCGSVDDGKSTLIGRLLFESRAVFTDHLSALEADSRKHGTQGDDLDLALLLDGLQAEREQGITIDVAYRHFATDRRRFILADSPGHEQYTRNMVTAASTADITVILIDARKGLLRQTRRHSLIVSLLGVHTVVLAVNKMDLVDWSEKVFDDITSAYEELAASLGIDSVSAIPASALHGDNVMTPSVNMPWYTGPSLLQALETLPIRAPGDLDDLRMPVQLINRPNANFRGYCGTIATGTACIGDRVIVQPSGVETAIADIVTGDGSTNEASRGDAITLVLNDDVDIVRGDVICSASAAAQVADVFQAHVVWMHDEPMLPGRTYLVKVNTRIVPATFHHPKYRLDPDTLEHLSADTLQLNEIGVCTFATSRPIAFDPYVANHSMGGFIIIDRFTNATVGAGMIEHAMRRSQNVQWQSVDVDRSARSRLAGHGSAIVWLTGLSGSGKSTIANALEADLHARGVRTYLLDGDNLRHGLSRDLGFSPADRVENIRRAGEVARLMMDAGVVVICAFISPYAAERAMVRAMVAEGEFFEVFVDAPLAEAERRDPKGLYAKARAGEITNFTGVDAPYELPVAPDLRIDTTSTTANAAAVQIRAMMTRAHILLDV